MTALGSRILVAAVLLPAVLFVVHLGGWWLFALTLAGGLVALHELYAMARGLRPLVLAGYAGLALVLLGMQLGGPVWALGGVLATVFLAFVLFGFAHERPPATAAIGSTLLGVAWLGGGLGCLLLIRDLPAHGELAMLTVLFTVFADDTAAFFLGRAIGRHQLAPAISPGKSWEGFVAGTLTAVLVAFVILYEDREAFLSVPGSLVFGVAVALGSTVGDLFESAVKRDLGAKDSGRLLAGHGGMLDRLDSLLFAGPVAYYVVLALGHA